MTINFDELTKNLDFTTGGKQGGLATFLPEPDKQQRLYTVISVDDHIVEPPNTFDGRIPASMAERGPRVVEKPDKSQVWVFDGKEFPNVGFNAVIGRPVKEYSFEPTRFDEMRRGAWDIESRIADMDLNGVYASLCFPSFLPGFAGQRIQFATSDEKLALATIQAWNDWHLEEWVRPYPQRMIPCQLPWLRDPILGAREIRKNADRGFKAVTFTEAPHLLGLPSLHTGYWDPIMHACEETDTVINLHVGSSSTSPGTASDAPADVAGVLFFGYAIFAAVDWLYSLIPVRFPNIKICLSEGGIGWVAGLMDRLDHMLRYHDMYGTWKPEFGLTPSEVLRRNFWFCAVEDPSAFLQCKRIGVENIMVESDYPHCDSTWPLTQSRLQADIGGLPVDVVQKLTWENASLLYRHTVPPAVHQNPESF